MDSTYSVTDAQAKLPALVKHAEKNLVAITRRDKTVAYLLSASRMEAIAETLEIMADPKAKTVTVLDRKALQAKAATKAQRESNHQPNIDKHPECFLPAMRR